MNTNPVHHSGDEKEEHTPLFPQYRLTERHSDEPVRYARQASWLAVVLAALLLWAQPEGYPPGYWVAMGTAMGALMILLGALELRDEGKHRTRLMCRMAETLDHWFPYLLFGLQTFFLFQIVSLIWFTLPSLGVYLHPMLHVGLFSLLTLITIRRLVSEWARHKKTSARLPIQDGLQAFTFIIITLLVAIALTHAVSPFGHPITGDNTLLLVIIWVMAGFSILCGVVLFADRAVNRRRK